MKFLIAFIFERISEARDIWAAIVDVCRPEKKDPKRWAETPPAWWHTGAVPVEVPGGDDWLQAKDGGIPNVFDAKGLRHVPSGGQTVAEQRAYKSPELEKLTAQEYGEMLAYRVSPTQVGLHNITLAVQVKALWKQGKKPKEIGLLVGCSESTARHYVICFERAQKASNTPLF